MLIDYHLHLLGHEDRKATVENAAEFLKQAENRNIKKVGFSDHQRFYKQFDFSVIQEAGTYFPDLEVKTGIEMNYIPGQEQRMTNLMSQFYLDHTIGSVHYIGDWPFDHPDYREEYEKWDLTELYKEYFSYVKEMVETGLFDIIGHLDLIKVFDFRPEEGVMELVEPVLEVIAREDQVIEVNTNGLNKPAEEIYPSRRILERAYQKGVTITLGSDAHSAERVGENLDQVREMLKEIGYREIAAFSDREREMVKL